MHHVPRSLPPRCAVYLVTQLTHPSLVIPCVAQGHTTVLGGVFQMAVVCAGGVGQVQMPATLMEVLIITGS